MIYVTCDETRHMFNKLYVPNFNGKCDCGKKTMKNKLTKLKHCENCMDIQGLKECRGHKFSKKSLESNGYETEY